METPERAPETHFVVMVDPDDEPASLFVPMHFGTNHGNAHSKAESGARSSGRKVRLYQEIAVYEAETKVIMRKPGE